MRVDVVGERRSSRLRHVALGAATDAPRVGLIQRIVHIVFAVELHIAADRIAKCRLILHPRGLNRCKRSMRCMACQAECVVVVVNTIARGAHG